MQLNSIIAIALSLSAATSSLAQEVPNPVDRPYPGVIELHVDATNVAQKIFKVQERFPVKPGRITLLYPQWGSACAGGRCIGAIRRIDPERRSKSDRMEARSSEHA